MHILLENRYHNKGLITVLLLSSKGMYVKFETVKHCIKYVIVLIMQEETKMNYLQEAC